MAAMTYKDSGVDIDAGQRLVDRIRPLAARTRTAEVLNGLGGFAGLCGLPSDVPDPVLVSGTDGVGTKLKLAFAMDKHDTIGQDLVAMCVNDVITTGARPLFFLDYFATGKLDVDRGESVVRGIADGCELAGCALLGGETAEMPGMYQDGEYDLAGFCVGVVSRSRILSPERVRIGDRLIGLPSSGLHSNGYSLARKVLFEIGGHNLTDPLDGAGESLGAALLAPTRIYAKAAVAAGATDAVHGMSHITGGGLVENIPRMLADNQCATLQPSAWRRPGIFDAIAGGGVEEAEMRRTFNLGLGFVFAVEKTSVADVSAALISAGESPMEVGEVTARGDGAAQVCFRETT